MGLVWRDGKLYVADPPDLQGGHAGAEGDAPGWLVLTDIWYPGWVCEVDGAPAQVHRANYLFRALRVPAGRHEVVFHFEPKSYQRGILISVFSMIVVATLGLAAALGAARRRTRRPEGGG
jgi:hypothetical protein